MATLKIFDDITESTLYAVSNFAENTPDGEDATIEIASHGGLVFYGTGTCQKMNEAKDRGVKFTAKVYGLAASSAADIVLACDHIKMADKSALMIHSAFNGSSEKDRGIEIANDAQLSVIRKRIPDYTAKDLEQDRWFTSSEALSLGICDEIFGIDKTSAQAKATARYLARCTEGGSIMQEIKAEFEEVKEEKEKVEEAEEVVEEKEEVKEEEKSPSVEEVIEKISERLDDLDARLAKLEGACGDEERKDEARMKAVWKRLNAVTKPVEAKTTTNVASTPEEDLERYKATYGNMNFDRYIKD